MKAMILGAGRGQRLRPITDTLPKPLVEVGGETLIARHLRRLRDIGVHEVVINLHHLGDQIEAALGSGTKFQMQIAYSREPQLLDIAGGVRQALPLLGSDPFLLLSADIWTDLPLNSLLAPLPQHLLGRIALIDSGLGQLYADNHGIASRTGALLDYAGVALFRPYLFAELAIAPTPLQAVLNPAVDSNSIAALKVDCRWVNIGTSADLARARALSTAG